MLFNYLPSRVKHFHFGKAQKMFVPSFYFLNWELGREAVVESLSWPKDKLAIIDVLLNGGWRLYAFFLSAPVCFSLFMGHFEFSVLFSQQPSTSNSFSSLKSIAAQAVATAGLSNPVPVPTDYSSESRGTHVLNFLCHLERWCYTLCHPWNL